MGGGVNGCGRGEANEAGGGKGGVYERNLYRVGRLGEGLLVCMVEKWGVWRNEQGRRAWVSVEQRGGGIMSERSEGGVGEQGWSLAGMRVWGGGVQRGAQRGPALTACQ